MLPRTLEWTGSSLRLLDQTKLPVETAYIDCTDEKMVWDAIRRLVVRGAPAIGVAAGFGAYLGIARSGGDAEDFGLRLREVCDYLATARPTAVNLFWALGRIQRVAAEHGSAEPLTLKTRLLAECHAMLDEDVECCRQIGEHGLKLLLQQQRAQPLRLLTHCNAGALATCGIGTALAPIYLGHERGQKFEIFADETRPLLQGARLTAYELSQAGISVTVLCDNMAASLLGEGKIDAIIVGADRIARNGDTANKIGTHGLAILANHFGVPFYVAAPTSTIDFDIADGSLIPIEQRHASEVTHPQRVQAAPAGVDAYNPAFDVTPAALITAIITEHGAAAPGELSMTLRHLTK